MNVRLLNELKSTTINRQNPCKADEGKQARTGAANELLLPHYCCTSPRARDLKLNEADGHNNDAEDNCLRLAYALPACAAIERVVDVERQELRELRGFACGEREVLVEELEAIGDGKEHADGDRGHHHGNGDTGELLPPVGTINLGCLENIVGNGLEASDVDDHPCSQSAARLPKSPIPQSHTTH